MALVVGQALSPVNPGVHSVLGLVMRQAAVLLASGIGIGLLAALAVMRILSSLLVNVSAHDP